MTRIIIKTVHGRKYRYERISTKRKNGKVKTTDKYLGPVVPAKAGRKSKMAGVPEAIQEEIRIKFSVGASVASMVQHLKDRGYTIGERALRNWFDTQKTGGDEKGLRKFIAAESGTAEARQRGWATRRKRAGEAKAKRESGKERERQQRKETEDVLKAQLKREAAEAAKWRRDAGEWQQRFHTIKR